MPDRRLQLGVAGLGRGFGLMLPTLASDPRLALVAAADPRPEARARFAADFGARTYDNVDALCRDGAVEAVERSERVRWVLQAGAMNARKHTSPSHCFAMGPSLSPLRAERGRRVELLLNEAA